jgi:hypothetical protein
MIQESDLYNPSYCLLKAQEYSKKAAAALDRRLKEGYEALAREYTLRANMIFENLPSKKSTDKFSVFASRLSAYETWARRKRDIS